jgi:hypothetical protein
MHLSNRKGRLGTLGRFSNWHRGRLNENKPRWLFHKQFSFYYFVIVILFLLFVFVTVFYNNCNMYLSIVKRVKNLNKAIKAKKLVFVSHTASFLSLIAKNSES